MQRQPAQLYRMTVSILKVVMHGQSLTNLMANFTVVISEWQKGQQISLSHYLLYCFFFQNKSSIYIIFKA